MCSIVYLLIPNSYFVLPPPLATTHLFPISVSTRMIFITSLNELTSLSKCFLDFFFKFTFPRVWFSYNILFLSLVQGYFIVIDLCVFLDVILSYLWLFFPIESNFFTTLSLSPFKRVISCLQLFNLLKWWVINKSWHPE